MKEKLLGRLLKLWELCKPHLITAWKFSKPYLMRAGKYLWNNKLYIIWFFVYVYITSVSLTM